MGSSTAKKAAESAPNEVIEVQQDEGTEATAADAPANAPLDRGAALRESYTDANKGLREKYADEFNQLRVEAMKGYGYEWTPPLTEEQKAQATIDELLASNPGLAALYQKTEAPE